jgi:hypothetical protein
MVLCYTNYRRLRGYEVGGWWFSPGTPVSFNKTDSHDITEILLKVTFNPITPTVTMTHYPDSEPTSLGLTPEYCILQSSILFVCLEYATGVYILF